MDESIAVKIRGISKKYPKILALDNISFDIKKESIHGFLGLNGAGKTTTMNIISGLTTASSGNIWINGININNVNLAKKPAIGFLPENPPLYHNMKVIDYLKFIKNINNISNIKCATSVNEVMERCGIYSIKNRLIANLSKGYKQRIGIAQAIIFDPEIVIFDEPTSNLDPIAITEIRKLIKELAKKRTVFLSTHQLHEASMICSDITVINKGKIIESAPLYNIKKKFGNNRYLTIELNNWDRKKEEILKQSFPIHKVELESKSPYTLKIFYDIKKEENTDIRSNLGQFFVENQCQLLSMQKGKSMELEDIFCQLTK